MDASEIILAVFIIASVLLTIYLRKDLEEHGLGLWVYLGFPLLAMSSMTIVLHDEIPEEAKEIFRPAVFIVGAFIIFYSAFQAYRRRD